MSFSPHYAFVVALTLSLADAYYYALSFDAPLSLPPRPILSFFAFAFAIEMVCYCLLPAAIDDAILRCRHYY